MNGESVERPCPHCREYIVLDKRVIVVGSTLTCPVCKKGSKVTARGLFGKRVALVKE